MSRILIFSSVLLLLACAKEGNKNGYQISGKIKNKQDAYVYLQELTLDDAKTIDSIKTDQEGQFVFEGVLQNPGFYRINIYNKQALTLVLDNEKVEITADGTSQDAPYTVKGSKATQDLQNLNEKANEFQTKVSQMNLEYTKAAESNDIDKKKKIEEEYSKLQTEYYRELKREFKKMDYSLTTILATDYMDPIDNFSFMDTIATNLKQKYPNSTLAKKFIEKTEKVRNISLGQIAPEINLVNPDGKEIALSSLKGKYVLIDFWASWCKPCREENPNVVRLYNQYKDKSFEILGVSLDDNKENWVKAINDDKLTWPHVSDLKGWESTAAATYQISQIPTTYLLDKEGKIIARNLRGVELENKLKELL
jgi:peroxiredoxin